MAKMAVDKLSRYEWAALGEQGEYRDLPIEQLVVDFTYQRTERSEVNILRIARDLDWMAFGTIIVAEREDGRFYVVDGQHRVEALRRRGDVEYVPSIVFQSIEAAKEALSFLRTSSARTPLHSMSKWKTRLAAGLLPEIEIDEWLKEHGLKLVGGQTLNGIDFPASLCRTWGADASACKLALLTQLAITGGVDMVACIHTGLWQLEHYGIDTLPHAGKLRELGGKTVMVQAINRYIAETGLSGRGERICAAALLTLINKKKRNKLSIPDRVSTGRRARGGE
jgi:hypothetical protein